MEMTWVAFLPFVAVATILIFVPGLILGVCASLRGWALLALAPVLSIAMIAISAIMASVIGIDWGIIPVLVLTLIIGVVLLAISGLRQGLSHRSLRSQAGRGRKDSVSVPSVTVDLLSSVAAIAIALALATRQWLQVIGRFDSFSQTFDNLFHLNGVRWIIDHLDGSSLTLLDMTGIFNTTVEFYPAAWHDLVSLVCLLVGDINIPAACNAVIWVLVALVWPLGCLWLIRSLLGPLSPVALIGAGILTASFAIFPTYLLGFGIIYPNIIGLILLPAVIGLTGTILRLFDSSRIPLPESLAAMILAGIGLALCHPNSILSLLVAVVPMGLIWAARGIADAKQESRRKASLLYGGVAVAALISTVAVWIVLRPPIDSADWGPGSDPEDALAQAVFAGPFTIPPFWVLGLLIIIGLVSLLKSWRNWWVVGTFALSVWLWMVVESWESTYPDPGVRWWLTGGWYCDPFRLAALLSVTSIPVAAVGWKAVVSWIPQKIETWRGRPLPVWMTVIYSLMLLLLLLLSTQTGKMSVAINWAAPSYVMNEDSALVDPDEYALIQQLPEIVPAGERVATVPWNGSSLAYGLAGVLTTTTHIFHEETPDLSTIQGELDEASSDPAVCPAVERLDVTYALDFGTRALWNADFAAIAPGFIDFATEPGFTEVARVGEAVLYRIDAC
ncbi:MAG: hypothetical protein LBM23_01680 [Propionibacteriaceae bacterium]|nr:hypothetical protein [Propionibacteriaceae bacterium]